MAKPASIIHFFLYKILKMLFKSVALTRMDASERNRKPKNVTSSPILFFTLQMRDRAVAALIQQGGSTK